MIAIDRQSVKNSNVTKACMLSQCALVFSVSMSTGN